MNMEKKYFRLHRRLYVDSMETMKEVASLSEIQNILDGGVFPKGYLSNIHIGEDTKREHRTPGDKWGECTYMVLADFDGYTNQCVGCCNFFEGT